MDLSHLSETDLVMVVILLGLGRVLVLRLITVLALALVLHGSTPSERPDLLEGFAAYQRQVPHVSPRAARRQTRQEASRQ